MTEEEFFKRYSFNVREDKIGGGSFGTVYRAYDNVLDREVAVKVSEVRISGDKEFSLQEEFKAIEKLPPHANIANYEEVHTFESFNGVFDYAIMQYYPLGNLDHFLSKNELNQEKKETLVLAIIDGIAHLHKHHIVQRDL
ncbi:protein kinase domain-containing protein, partial [Christiangramia echinicola]|uniref:protein kinase domain-containing protein n=1 Tax=Christiangramia echinicola TaxID=279359 RepID=UPI00047C12B5